MCSGTILRYRRSKGACTMKIKCIINEHAGKGRKGGMQSGLKRHFAGHLFDIATTAHPGHALEIAAEAAGGGYDTIVAVGGDGTINEIVNGIRPARIPIGIIPTGTANDLADYLGLPADLEAACDIILRRNVRTVDAIRVNGWYFLTAGGFGLPARAVATAAAMKRRQRSITPAILSAGSKIYIISLFHAFLRNRGRSIVSRFDSPQFSYTADIYSLVLANQPVLGRCFKVCPGADNGDGSMDIFIIKNDGSLRRYALSVLRTFDGSQAKMPNVGMYRAESLRIETDEPTAFFGDGTIGPTARKFDIRVVPGAINILTPKEKGAQR